MKKVLLDTSFLLAIAEYKLDFLSLFYDFFHEPFQLIIGTNVLGELEKLSRGRGRQGSLARIAKLIIEKNKGRLLIVEGEGYVDDWLISYALKNNAMICTADMRLKNKAKKSGAGVVVLRGFGKLEKA